MEEENELFKECGKGIRKTYFISNFGNCKSIDNSTKREYIIKPFKLTKGYLGIDINKKTEKIHRLVALHFIGERPTNLQIDHKDRNKNNNKVSNLRYISGEENIKNTDRYRLDLSTDKKTRLNQIAKISREKNKDKNREKKKESDKKFYEKNKEKLKKYRKEWYEENKDKNREKRKEYYEKNKDKFKEKRKEKYTCECGSIIIKSDKLRHEKTKKHQNFINSK